MIRRVIGTSTPPPIVIIGSVDVRLTLNGSCVSRSSRRTFATPPPAATYGSITPRLNGRRDTTLTATERERPWTLYEPARSVLLPVRMQKTSGGHSGISPKSSRGRYEASTSTLSAARQGNDARYADRPGRTAVANRAADESAERGPFGDLSRDERGDEQSDGKCHEDGETR